MAVAHRTDFSPRAGEFEKNRPVRVTVWRRPRWKAARLAHGAYLLRINHPSEDPAQLWRWYIQLTQAEAAFRTGKSDLHLRPVFHQTTARVEAHILVSFLSLALWRALEQWITTREPGAL